MPARTGNPLTKRKPPTADELELMVTHIRHQFELLAITHTRLQIPADITKYESRLEHAASRTAYLVALRTIIAFFDNDPGKFGTGMRASDYYGGWIPKTNGSQALKDLKKMRSKINQRVAHIDVARVRTAAPIAKDLTTWVNVNKLMNRFTDQIDQRWKSRFYSSLESALAYMQASGPEGPADPLPVLGP